MLFQGLLSAVLAVFSFMIASVDEAEYTRKLSTIAGMDNLKPDDKNYRAGMRTKKIA